MSSAKLTIAEQEENLFREWEQRAEKYFVLDGVVDEQAYLASKPKVVFVLKEYPHQKPKSEKFDLRENELHGSNAQDWDARLWVKVAKIQHAVQMRGLPESKRSDFDGNMPCSICALNLNKEGGHSETDMEHLEQVAKRDAEFIRRQFEIYKPDLTICMGYQRGMMSTIDVFLRSVLEIEGYETKANKLPDDWRWFKLDGAGCVLEMYHPAYTAETYKRAVERVLTGVEAIDKIYPFKS